MFQTIFARAGDRYSVWAKTTTITDCSISREERLKENGDNERKGKPSVKYCNFRLRQLIGKHCNIEQH